MITQVNVIEIVEDAVIFSDPAYLATCLNRTSGSRWRFPLCVEILKALRWEEANDPDIKAPAVGFRAPLPGVLGIIHVDHLPKDANLVLEDGHVSEDKPDGCGFVGLVWEGSHRGPSVNFTTLLLGPGKPYMAEKCKEHEWGMICREDGKDVVRCSVCQVREDGEDDLVVWTLFPGAAISPSTVERVTDGVDLHGKVVTLEEAKAMGFDYAKIRDLIL